jgi:hypothetical protein
MKRGRKRSISHQMVLVYAKKHPDSLQSEIGAHFGISQRSVSRILQQNGQNRGLYRGRPLERKRSQSEDEHYWEKKLHDAGLGMDRGLRLDNQRIFYGYDPAKEESGDESAT